MLLLISLAEKMHELDNPLASLRKIPASVDLREFGLVEKPKDIGLSACGSGAAAVASLAESNILRAWDKYEENPQLAGTDSKDLDVSIQFFLNGTRPYKKSKGYYCTSPAEFILNDALLFETIELNRSPLMSYAEFGRQYNPEFDQIVNFTVDSDMISAASEYIQPFYIDEKQNGLITLFHTPFFSLAGEESAGSDVIDLMKEYLARGVTLIAEIELGTDKIYQQFTQFTGTGVFQAECKRIFDRYNEPSYEAQVARMIKNGYNERQERAPYVNIVGYGTKDGQEVWIVKLPFGIDFASMGYMYFPVGNNTLCLEEYVITALPSGVSSEELNKVFTAQEAEEMGLTQSYNIRQLISDTFAGKDIRAIVETDAYTGGEGFSTSYRYDSTYLHDAGITSINAEYVTCTGPGTTYDTVNCSAAIYLQFGGTASEKALDAFCYLIDHVSGAALGDAVITGSQLAGDLLECILTEQSTLSGRLHLQSYIVALQVLQAVSASGSTVTDGVTVEWHSFEVIKTYLAKDVAGNDKLWPKALKYSLASAQQRPRQIGYLGLLPGVLRCSGNACRRDVHDARSSIHETWDCSIEGEIAVCRAPEADRVLPGGAASAASRRPNITYYGEITQDIVFCKTSGIFYCPPSYNMNFTSLRTRTNDTNRTDEDGGKTAFSAQNFTSILTPYDYLMGVNSSITGDYLSSYYIANDELQTNMNISIVFPDNIERQVLTDCRAPTPKSNGKDYTLMCRSWNATLKVCSNLDWMCSAPLYGWSSTTSTLYSVVASVQMPLLLEEHAVPGVNFTALPSYSFEYTHLKLDSIEIEAQQNDAKNYAFNPCEFNAEKNTDVCRDIVVSDLHFRCSLGSCVAIDSFGKPSADFVFSQSINHSYVNNQGARKKLEASALESEKLADLASISEFICTFNDLACELQKNPSSFVCEKGTIVCRGRSQITQTIFSDTLEPVKLSSGTQIFTFETTDFDCSFERPKQFDEDFKIYETSGAEIGTIKTLWADLVCTIRNSELAYSKTTVVSQFLVRGQNSIDDVLGDELTLTQDKKMRSIFTSGLICITVAVLMISLVLALFPGAIKGCMVSSWNMMCCEKCRSQHTIFDKYGVALLGDPEEVYQAVDFGQYNIDDLALSLYKGFDGLTMAKLQEALKAQQEKIASGVIYERPHTAILATSNAINSGVSSILHNTNDNDQYEREAEDIETLFSKKQAKINNSSINNETNSELE